MDGAVKKELSLSLRDLKTRYKQHEVACALQCAGLRRHTMRTFLKEVSGIDWGDGAVMNCTWKGPKLNDILNEAGIDLIMEETGHVAFACYYTVCTFRSLSFPLCVVSRVLDHVLRATGGLNSSSVDNSLID